MATTIPWLDDREQVTWLSWLRLSAELPAALHRQLQSDADLSLPDYDVLVQLAAAPQRRLRTTALARAVHWERSRLSHHVKRMESRGLVERVACDDDGRGNFVELTRAGAAALAGAAPGHVAAVRHYFLDALDADEQETLAALTGKVLARLDGITGSGATDAPCGRDPG
jgi:DNA-binding MarR family transcriptional regulator